MLRRFFNASPDSLNAAEEAAVSSLAAASHHASDLDIKSNAGVEGCAAYLNAVEATATQLQIPPTQRSYRTTFPLNYRSLFPSEARSYRADVLEASLEHYNVIWVNGEKFEFTAEATQRAEELQVAWIDLGTMLERWNRNASRERCGATHDNSPRPTRQELTAVLKALDSAWASFEERYISELVQIEAKARSHIVQAIELERQLKLLDMQHGEDAWTQVDYVEVQRSLISAVAHLNSVANVNRKGRDDLRVEVLQEAMSALRQCNAAGNISKEAADLFTATKILASDVVDSFEAMRVYLRDVANHLERVDPHLGNNCGLVARLVDWEESWEVGTAYLQQKRVLHALCDAVADIHRVQSFVPKLADMCEECDVELFMVLPRLMWLRFLAEPEKQMPLLARLLPHRFGAASSETPTMGKELLVFYDKYASVQTTLDRMLIHSKSTCASSASGVRQLLAKRVIRCGHDESIAPYADVPHAHLEEAKALVEDLMHELEAWSIELQRHCPEDWNQYSAVLVRCLRTEADKERKGPFGV
jgi:hypothetical protein